MAVGCWQLRSSELPTANSQPPTSLSKEAEVRGQLRRFRPMGIADILDETVELYRNNFALLIGIAAVVYVPFFILQGLVPEPKVTPEGGVANLGMLFASFALLMVFVLLIEPIVTGALTFAISDSYLGRPTTIPACFRRILRPAVLFGFIGAVMLKYLIVIGATAVGVILMVAVAGVAGASGSTGGAIAAVAVAVVLGVAVVFLMFYLILRLVLVEPCFIIEMTGAAGAIGRAWRLIQGNLGKAFALILIAGLVAAVIPMIVTLPSQLAISYRAPGAPPPSHAIVVIDLVLRAIMQTLFVPVTSIVTILLYYDIRIRKEGFDLVLLANELDSRTRQFAAPDVTALPQEAPPPQQPYESPPPNDGGR